MGSKSGAIRKFKVIFSYITRSRPVWEYTKFYQKKKGAGAGFVCIHVCRQQEKSAKGLTQNFKERSGENIPISPAELECYILVNNNKTHFA